MDTNPTHAKLQSGHCNLCEKITPWLEHHPQIKSHFTPIHYGYPIYGGHQFLVINLYNPLDNSVVKALKNIKLSQIPILITGDFNLHHPMWSMAILETNPETLGGQGDTKAD